MNNGEFFEFSKLLEKKFYFWLKILIHVVGQDNTFMCAVFVFQVSFDPSWVPSFDKRHVAR